MLSAFKAQPIIELKQQDKSKIESIIAYGDRILVGLSTGVLRIYRVIEDGTDQLINSDQKHASICNTPQTPSKRRVVELLSERENFARKAIQQLAVIKESNVLISLSDGYVTFHDLQTFEVTERLEKTKGATAFAATCNIVRDESYEIASLVSRLAVTVKRKIYIWTWKDMELVGAAKELTLIGPIKSLTWATDEKIVAGMDAGFVMIDVNKMAASDIHRQASHGELSGAAGTRFGAVNSTAMGYVGMSSWIPKPLSTKLFGEKMLLAKDVNSLFIDLDGNPLPKRQIKWHTAPDAVGYSYPYLLALQTTAKRGLEIHNPDTLNLLQTIQLPNATIIHVPQATTSLAHAGRGFLVASERCIWRMNAIDYDCQIDELISQTRYDEALSLMQQLEDTLLRGKSRRQREVKILKAKTLFENQYYRSSIDLFIEAEAPPDILIELYPQEIAGSWSIRDREQDNAVAEIREGDHEDQESSSPLDAQQSKTKDTSQLQEVDAQSILSETLGTRVSTDGLQKVNNKLEGRDLTIAVRELQSFLVHTRTQISKYLDNEGKLKTPPPHIVDNEERMVAPEFEHLLPMQDRNNTSNDVDWEKELHSTAVLVDTTLFRAYLFINPRLVGALLRLDNFCNPQVVREHLITNEKYNELIDFLHAKKRYGEVLELLERFGKDEERVHEDSDFTGPRKMVSYLQQLPFEKIDEILSFAQWPMEQDPELGMQIFLADTDNAERLPRNRVLKFLFQIDKRHALRYLEHIVEELDDQTVDFHEQMLSLYLESLTSLKDSEKTEDIARMDELQKKLEIHLTNSRFYNKMEALKKLPLEDPRFFESRVIVLRKLSYHTRALQIYVFEMQNYQKAEEYCNQVFLNLHSTAIASLDPDNPDQAQSVYTSLLSLYLTPPSGKQQNLEAALQLMSRHGSRLPALSTLNVLPLSLAVSDLEAYFRARMRNANSLAREEAIVRALTKVDKSEVESTLLFGEKLGRLNVEEKPPFLGKNGRVIMTENTLCKHCHQRFGRSAVRVWPTGEVVHYGCALPKKQSTARKERFHA